MFHGDAPKLQVIKRARNAKGSANLETVARSNASQETLQTDWLGMKLPASAQFGIARRAHFGYVAVHPTPNMQRAFAFKEDERSRRFFPRLLMIGVSVSLTASSLAAASDPVALRARALEMLAPLPKKMPGAANDTLALM